MASILIDGDMNWAVGYTHVVQACKERLRASQVHLRRLHVIPYKQMLLQKQNAPCVSILMRANGQHLPHAYPYAAQ